MAGRDGRAATQYQINARPHFVYVVMTCVHVAVVVCLGLHASQHMHTGAELHQSRWGCLLLQQPQSGYIDKMPLNRQNEPSAYKGNMRLLELSRLVKNFCRACQV